jgi:glycosyltransferase involved in cell wall biosynthesis
MVDRNRHRANVFHVNADQMLATYCALGSDFFNSRYNIGYWAWELSKWPADWVPTLDMVDEIWAPSRFIRDCLKTVTDKPVVHMPLCVELPHFGRRSRSHFGLPEGDCLFLYTFDFHSYIDRKNPLAAVRAFKRAFPSGKEKAGLVLKIMKGDPESPKWQEMIEAIDHDPRIYVINQMMSRADVLALLDSCDCFLSLHRSEGFGRGPAEAMYLGKAVIATNYSGNVDFTRPGASLLVDYQLVPVKPGEYVCGEGQVWADPDVDHAARQMLLVQQGSAEVQEIAARGQEVILTEFSNAAVGRNMRKRLTEIGALPTWIGRQFHRWGQRKPAPARPHWPKAEHRRKNKPRPSRQS